MNFQNQCIVNVGDLGGGNQGVEVDMQFRGLLNRFTKTNLSGEHSRIKFYFNDPGFDFIPIFQITNNDGTTSESYTNDVVPIFLRTTGFTRTTVEALMEGTSVLT